MHKRMAIFSTLLVVLFGLALTALAQVTVVNLLGGESAEINCDGDRLVFTRTSATNVTANCRTRSETPTDEPNPEPTDPPPPEPTNTPVPEPTDEPSSSVPLCQEHDPRKWHGLYDPEKNCHYNHEHHANPHDMDDVFGTQFYEWAGGEISYPWQTFKGANYQFEPAPALDSGTWENDMKHNQYSWGYKRDRECDEIQLSGTKHCISDFRVQYHAIMAQPGALTAFHSMYIEALAQTANNECERFGPNRCYAALGGWLDTGRLRTNDGNGTIRIPLPGDNPAYDDVPLGQRPYRSHPMGPTGDSTPPNALHSWNSDGNELVPAYGDARIYFGYGIHVRDGWGPMDPSNPANVPLTCPDFQCEYNNSSVAVFRAWVNFPERLDGSVYDEDGARNGFVTMHGYTNRYGDIVTYKNRAGDTIGDCTQPALDCVPFVAEHYPAGQTRYRGSIEEDEIEYDTSPPGEWWIEYPN